MNFVTQFLFALINFHANRETILKSELSPDYVAASVGIPGSEISARLYSLSGIYFLCNGSNT